MSKTRIEWIEEAVFHPGNFTDQRTGEGWHERTVRSIEIAVQKWEESQNQANPKLIELGPKTVRALIAGMIFGAIESATPDGSIQSADELMFQLAQMEAGK